MFHNSFFAMKPPTSNSSQGLFLPHFLGLTQLPFFFADNNSQITVHCNKNSSRRVLAILTACIFIGNSCCVGCKSPSLFGFFVELLLHLFFSHSVFNYKEDMKGELHFHMCFFSVLQVGPFNKLHLTILDSFCIPFLSSRSSCRGLFGFACFQMLAFNSVLSCILIFCPLLYGAHSDAALTTTRRCPNINET